MPWDIVLNDHFQYHKEIRIKSAYIHFSSIKTKSHQLEQHSELCGSPSGILTQGELFMPFRSKWGQCSHVRIKLNYSTRQMCTIDSSLIDLIHVDNIFVILGTIKCKHRCSNKPGSSSIEKLNVLRSATQLVITHIWCIKLVTFHFKYPLQYNSYYLTKL